MRALALVEPGGDHRATDCAVVAHDRLAGESSSDTPDARPLLPPGQTPAHPASAPHGAARREVRTPEFALQHLYVILRCNRWGTYVRWSHRTLARDPAPQDTRSWWGPIVLDGNVEQIGLASVLDLCPVDIPEALETGTCVERLPDHLRKAMLQEHVIRGTQAQKSRALEIERTAFWRRCERAYVLLLGMFNDEAAK